MKRLLAAILSAAMLTSITACGAPAPADPSAASSASAGSSAAPASDEPAVPFKETFEFSVLSTIWSPYDAESTLLDEIMAATNTKINIEWAPPQDFDTKVNTLLASNSLPDTIWGASIGNLINQEAAVALDPYYEAFAPNILKALTPEDYPFIRNVSDGKIYAVPSVFDFKPMNSWIIRKDWLDKLGLAEPTTWEEWLTVWRAFRDKDPNGDKKLNEIPLAGQATTLYEAFGILGAGGEKEKDFCILPDGTYSLVYEHPNFPLFLETMKSLYAEKLLDQEFATRMTADRYKAIDSNLAGSTFAAAEQSKLSTQVLQKDNPEAWVTCVAPVIGPKGDQMIPSRPKMGTRGVITVAAEKSQKVEKLVQYYDWFYSDAGIALTNFGVEGKHHNVENGEKILQEPYNQSFVEARKNGLIFQMIPFFWTQQSYLQILLTGKSYKELDQVTKNFYDGLFMNEKYFKTAPPVLQTTAYREKGADFMPKLKENMSNVIAGRMTIDEFNKAYNDMKAKGLQSIIDEAKDAYPKMVKGS